MTCSYSSVQYWAATTVLVLILYAKIEDRTDDKQINYKDHRYDNSSAIFLCGGETRKSWVWEIGTITVDDNDRRGVNTASCLCAA